MVWPWYVTKTCDQVWTPERGANYSVFSAREDTEALFFATMEIAHSDARIKYESRQKDAQQQNRDAAFRNVVIDEIRTAFLSKFPRDFEALWPVIESTVESTPRATKEDVIVSKNYTKNLRNKRRLVETEKEIDHDPFDVQVSINESHIHTHSERAMNKHFADLVMKAATMLVAGGTAAKQTSGGEMVMVDTKNRTVWNEWGEEQDRGDITDRGGWIQPDAVENLVLPTIVEAHSPEGGVRQTNVNKCAQYINDSLRGIKTKEQKQFLNDVLEETKKYMQEYFVLLPTEHQELQEDAVLDFSQDGWQAGEHQSHTIDAATGLFCALDLMGGKGRSPDRRNVPRAVVAHDHRP